MPEVDSLLQLLGSDSAWYSFEEKCIHYEVNREEWANCLLLFSGTVKNWIYKIVRKKWIRTWLRTVREGGIPLLSTYPVEHYRRRRLPRCKGFPKCRLCTQQWWSIQEQAALSTSPYFFYFFCQTYVILQREKRPSFLFFSVFFTLHSKRIRPSLHTHRHQPLFPLFEGEKQPLLPT